MIFAAEISAMDSLSKRFKMADIIAVPVGLLAPYLSIYLLYSAISLKAFLPRQAGLRTLEELLLLAGIVAIYLAGWVAGPIYAGAVMGRWFMGYEKERRFFAWSIGVFVGIACFLFWHSNWATWCHI
jgi:hypothetical protein